MEVSKMSVLLGLLFLALAIGIGIWRTMKTVPVPEGEVLKAKPPPLWRGIFVHPGHAWVEVLQPSLVVLGADDFAKSVFGSVERLTLPEPGMLIQQGGKAWKLNRGERELVQTSPITGRVVEINRELESNPTLLIQKDTKKNWILKVKPTRLKTELENLLHGTMLSRWNQAVKDQLVATLTTAEFPVLQEGGEIKPDLGDELTSEQWEKVTKEFFAASKRE
jgi:glycine cleavage system H lipoate-binding protein